MSAPSDRKPLPPVRHLPAEGRFVLALGGAEGFAAYRREGGTVSFHHTFVPPQLRGRGVAEAVVVAGLAWARAEGLHVRPDCSYVAALLARRPELLAPPPSS